MNIRCGSPAWLAVFAAFSAAAENLVFNGSFEADPAGAPAPPGWSVSGDRTIRQDVVLDDGADGGRCARLACTVFDGDGPSAHAMLCQVGKVAVQEGRTYRLSFRTRGRDIPSGFVEVAMSDMNGWKPAGLSEVFGVGPSWERHEFLFRAERTVPAATSRLQFWFKGTGTFWLDDVELAEASVSQEWFPQISSDGVRNLIPNSSFEFGDAQWGSVAPGVPGWAGNLFRLEGRTEDGQAPHGRSSLRIEVSPAAAPVYWFDYYEPVRQPMRCVLAANRGWIRVKPGEPLTLSAHLKADAAGVTARLAAIEPPLRMRQKTVTIGTSWQRHTFTFTPEGSFVFVALGPDLAGSTGTTATVWIDAVQLERGVQATAYAPRAAVECFVEAPPAAEGNTFTDPAAGAALMLRGFNDGDADRSVTGRLQVTDFFDRRILDRPQVLQFAPRETKGVEIPRIAAGQRGYFRADWIFGGATQTLRMAVIDPAPAGLRDSPFGFNHVYPWDFLVRRARQAGIVWWRDWSAKWQTLEPEKGRFDFAPADAQIRRVLEADGQVDVLMPFPSAGWNSRADSDAIAREAGNNGYLKDRMRVACAPERLEDFAPFAARVAGHYATMRPRPAMTFQILNESVYTTYALPARFGYTVDDYVRLLAAAHGAIKAAVPSCRIVGGPGAQPDSAATREFIAKGGLRYVDVMDVHMYAPPIRAEHFDEVFGRMEDLMREHGGPKPIWLTEWGCYADDDPPSLPWGAGDASMNRSRWPSERAASEHIVRFAAATFAHGMRKIFFHAGTCGAINGPDAGGVLFEYGGAPRKMLPAVSAFTRIVGVPDACERVVRSGGVRAYVFRGGGRFVAVAWSSDRPTKLSVGGAVRVYDIMGNEMPAGERELDATPIYLVGEDTEGIVKALAPAE